VGVLGPGLGGGHGYLQGKYGLVSDQFISLRMVLADGSIKTISPSSSQSDLWWAMNGAGHNFGIVTSATMKIHDIGSGVWSYVAYIFTHDKVEEIYRHINNLAANGTQPAEILHFSTFYHDPDVDPKNVS
jgi:FAD/FMN-containing dehydrogenase